MSSGTKKLITFILIALVVIFTIIGCVYIINISNKNNKINPSSNPNISKLSASQINKEIIESMGYQGISELKSSDISGHINVPQDSVTQTSIYLSNSNVLATELACFKLKDANQEQALRDAITSHISTKLKGFKDNPKECEKIENYVLTSSNGFLFMGIADNADTAEQLFLDVVTSS
ncbi:MAG: DUF4358 domain-containing protein [Acutalibacteraceae bacterium]